MEPILRAEKLTKRFGELTANREIDIEIHAGEIHAIAGENGAGKSTMMKMLYGVYQPTAGNLYIDGEKMERWNPTIAREKGIGLDFNPTYFSHPMLRDNWTLASPEKEVRDFWVQHGIACRRIGEYFGRELGETCITNHWIPDGSKDTRVDTLGPRERLVESLDRIFAEPIDRKYNRDSVEGKVFGLGLESYTAGSHEFYTNYALTTGKAMVCMDTGHYHPTESVAAKLSSYFVFGQEIMTHLSRAVRWDSDHVATVSEETVAIMQEIKRCNAFDKVHLGLDFFDASIDRVSASVIGARSVKKALMIALLEPTDKLMEAEREGNFTRRLALLEEFKMLPAGIVFDEYCRRHDVPGADWAAKL